MSAPVIATKFYIPPLRPNAVMRPRLIAKLNRSLEGNLTLISAPAGFGKTTLVCGWATNCERQIAWLSLDEADNDIVRFLTYLVTAVQTVAPNVGEGVIRMLQKRQQSTDLLLTLLINELTPIANKFILVLDDFHLIDGKPIENALAFLVEQLPPQIHIVIITREDPVLPLARWRARGKLIEIRAADMRFTINEAAEFLTQTMGLDLSTNDIDALETRTEGWIAGLQMAALSLQGRADTANFIKAFTGSHRFVLDYLLEEVLECQPEHIRRFLLQTSILDQLNGSLCDAVTKQKDSRRILADLDRSNLFVVPLDDQRQWYRYHHLFADVLRAHLMEEQSDQVAALHLRASEWYQQNDLWSDAIYQALAAKDFERSAGLIELAWPAMDASFQFSTWLGWVKALPEKLIRSQPVLCVQFAETLINVGDLEAAEFRLQDAEQWLENLSNQLVFKNEEQVRILPAKIAINRASLAQVQGNTSDTIMYAEQALKLTTKADPLKSQAAVLLGFTYWSSGNLEAARQSFSDWVSDMQMAGNIQFAVATAFVLADIMVAQGHLREAIRTYQQSLQLAGEHGKPLQQVTAHHHLGLAMLYHERGDKVATDEHLQIASEMGEQTELVDWPYRWCIAQARLMESRGEFEAALDELYDAKRLYVRTPVPDIHPVSALKARVNVRQGRVAKAQDWVRENNLSVDDEINYLREFEYITLARVLIAGHKNNPVDGPIHKAIILLERLQKAAQDQRRQGSVIEILVLQALAYQAQGNMNLALTSLEYALRLSEPEGYCRIFVDEGLSMVALLRRLKVDDGRLKAYIHKLLSAYDAQERLAIPSVQIRTASSVHQALIEPLSKRELEVLRLLRTELNGPEIALELSVSLNTIRTHIQNIYSKFGVNNRQAAIRRAQELDLP
jgi:LuxR family transcriptional regulator, maltose regulon positive regulatory protein